MNLAREAQVVAKYKVAINAFKLFCTGPGALSSFEEIDFYDLSLGFFAALGVPTDDDPDEESELFMLARICRYDFQYWC